MQGIKNIIFDLGGVIINLNNQLTEDAFVALGTKPFREYFGHGHAAAFFKDYEVGKISDRQFIDAVKELTGISASDQEIVRAWNALLLDFPPERIRLLKELGKRYRLFLFSNTNALHLAALQKIYRDTFPVGELDDRVSERVQKVSRLLIGAGLKAPVLTDTRGEVWLKLLGNVTFNPISALTHATVIDMCRYPLTRNLINDMMLEAQAVAEGLGVNIRLPIERRITGAEKLGRHKMSMLQDVEAGRELEIDALVGAVAELGELIGIPTPLIKALYASVKLLDKTMREAGAPLRFTRT